jgi:very-short-patch-repair endonuclease
MKKHPLNGAHIRARALRRDMTDAERKLWRVLRQRQVNGLKFRRQVPLGRYIADFVCYEVRLIVEIDGGQHENASPREAERTAFLQDEGYRVLRFWNNEVLANLAGVYDAIVGELSSANPTQTLPHRGGGP